MAKLKASELTNANQTGTQLEGFIRSVLLARGYKPVERNRFMPARYLEQPIFATQFQLGLSIYDTELFCDFILYHPEKWPDCLVIESKWQQVSGSVDEKFPFTVLNIKMKSQYKTVILLDGKGYKPGAETWLRQQVDGKLLYVFSMAEFQKWANRNNL